MIPLKTSDVSGESKRNQNGNKNEKHYFLNRSETVGKDFSSKSSETTSMTGDFLE